MADPLGLIGGGAGGMSAASRALQQNRAHNGGADTAANGNAVGGPDFKKVFLDSLSEVNKAQQEADRATEDLMSGERADVENVILATQKADNAFRMLQQLRNKMVEAYDEIKQVRV